MNINDKRLLIFWTFICVMIIGYIVFACYMMSYAFTEKDYQTKWCDAHHGIMEYVLPDKTRVDCYIESTDRFDQDDGYAVEFDFAKKWAEAYGQSVFYGKKTGRKPGIVLIMEKESDDRYLKRLQSITDCNNVKVWTITPEDL